MSINNRIDPFETLSWPSGLDEAEFAGSLSDISTEPLTDEPSETSDDGAFVASDAESSTYSSRLSDPFDLYHAPSVVHDERRPDEVGTQIDLFEPGLTALKVGLKRPVNTIQ
ncbi:hypothetical protein N7456_007132 [Penicillium angulare]|uniref:Uncharacterized protein n=1 Tax=Penicillium angulare TaxID=116970 RepID=A0A9W9FJ36_9EURO|nr:hypothetical protein N7456_007132 [Penicillium angulare]